MIVYIVKYKIYISDDYYYDCFVNKKQVVDFYNSIVDYVQKPYEFYILETKLCDCKNITAFAFIGGHLKL